MLNLLDYIRDTDSIKECSTNKYISAKLLGWVVKLEDDNCKMVNNQLVISNPAKVIVEFRDIDTYTFKYKPNFVFLGNIDELVGVVAKRKLLIWCGDSANFELYPDGTIKYDKSKFYYLNYINKRGEFTNISRTIDYYKGKEGFICYGLTNNFGKFILYDCELNNNKKAVFSADIKELALSIIDNRKVPIGVTING